MLAKLPPEMFDHFAQSLDKSDLRSLALVSRAVHHAVQRTLWKSLDLSPINEDELWIFKSKKVLDKNLPMFNYVRELNFNSQFNQINGERCPHYLDMDDYAYGLGEENGRSRWAHLARAAKFIVEMIPPGRLQKFTWGLGTCVPKCLLGKNGILAREQSQVHSLSLTTAGDCMMWSNADLSLFHHLKSFCWRGPRLDDLGTMAVPIRNNCKSLTHLELDLVDWGRIYHEICDLDDEDTFTVALDQDFFGKLILSMDDVLPTTPLFPALVSLSLSSVPLKGRTGHALDLGTLQSLTLRNCEGWPLFLAEITKLKPPVQLKTFEVRIEGIYQHWQVSAAEHDALLGFIDSFQGLEELFLSLARPIDALQFWSKVATRHRATIKRFVHHQRLAELGGRAQHADDLDIPDFDLGPKLSQLQKENPLRDIHCLESIGVSCLPEILGPMFASFTRRTTPSSLQLIHIRQTRRGRFLRGSWVTRGSSPSILQQYEPQYLGVRPANASDRYFTALNKSCYATPWIADSKSQELPPVDSEEEARRMEYLRQACVVLEDIRPTGRDHLPSLPPDKRAILREPVRRFANWAFGSKGLPALRVIALGDFAHGRVKEGLDNMFLVRGEGGTSMDDNADKFSIFWPKEKGSQYWAELVERNHHLLEACPAEPLVDYDVS